MRKFKKVTEYQNSSVEGFACFCSSCSCGTCSCDCSSYQPDYAWNYSAGRDASEWHGKQESLNG